MSRNFKLVAGSALVLVLVLVQIFAFQTFVLPESKVSAAGTTYYVAKNGSDSNPGTESQPWLTLKKAADSLVAGDTVYVKAGTYKEQLAPSHSGSSGAWITYKANPGDTVTIDGSGLNIGSTGLVYINGKAYIEVNGFQVVHSSYVGALIWGASNNITLKNLTITDTQRSGINTSYDSNASQYISNIIISGCNISYTNYSGYWEAISFNRTRYFEIADNIVHDTQGQSSSIGVRKEGIDCKVGSTDGSIHDNTVYNTRQGIYIDAAGTTNNISIYDNYVHNIDYFGIYFESESGNGVINGASVYNNIVSNSPRGIVCGSGIPSINISIVNNTTYHNSGYELSFTASASTYKSCIIRNNIFDGTSTLLSIPSGAGVTVDHNLFYGSSSSSTFGSNYIQKDPLFVSATGANFAIQSTSPAKDAGSATDAPSTDYNGASPAPGFGI